MKYIKKYKIYEGKDTIKAQDVRDCFNDLLDSGFSINIGFPNGLLYYGYVTITKPIEANYFPFKMSEVIETLLFAIPYLQAEYGLDTKELKVSTVYNKYSYNNLNELNNSPKIIYKIDWEFYVPIDLNIIHEGNRYNEISSLNESSSVDTINWAMIEDIKDMALEYLDDNYLLAIYVYDDTHKSIYRLFYSHENGVQDVWRLKEANKNWSNSDKLGKIYYRILLYNLLDDGTNNTNTDSNDLIDRIKEAYPNEDIR